MHNERLCAYCHAKPYKAVWSMSKGGGAPLKPSKSRGNKLGLQAVVIERLFLWIYHCEQWSKKLILAKLPHLMLLSLSMLRRWRRTRFHQAKVRQRLRRCTIYVICTTQEFGLLPLNEIKRIFINISVLHYLT